MSEPEFFLLSRIRKSRWFRPGTGFRFSDYVLAAVRNPRLFFDAARLVLTRRSRAVESALRASRDPSLRVNAPKRHHHTADTLVTGLTERMAVLELSKAPGRLHLGVADVDLISALVHLTSAVPNAVLRIEGTMVNFGMPKVKSRIMAAKSISVDVSVGFEEFRFLLEGFVRLKAGHWVSPNTDNRIMRSVYSDLFETAGYYRATDLLGAPTLIQQAENRPVDAVYTWVNHGDPDWYNLYLHWKDKLEGRPTGDDEPSTDDAESSPLEVSNPPAGDAATMSRFRDNGELRYSLRALRKNAPWINRIFVFTNCARPSWLKDREERLVWVRHEDVIPQELLPTFNSHVIESYLHHIPDLSEQFLYLNDDFFIMKPMNKSDFFTVNGLSLSRLENYGMVSGEVSAEDQDYLNASRNSAALVRESLGFAPVHLHQHVPYALRCSVLEEIESRFRDKIDEFRVNRFRLTNDINIPSFLYHHYALGRGLAISDRRPSILIKSNDIRWRDRINQLSENKHNFVCFNEGGAHDPGDAWRRNINDFLRKTFSEKAEWEV